MKKLLLLITLVAGVIAFALPAQADKIKFDLNFEFSGATSPAGTPPPWLTATFDDGNEAGSVTLTMEATNLTGAEHVKGWYFNFESSDIVVKFLEIDYSSGNYATVLQNPLGPQDYKADGDGLFDLLFEFPEENNPNDPFDSRFGVGDTTVFTILGTNITVNSFNLLSETKNKNKTGYLSAAHVGGIGTEDDSGWIAPMGGAVQHGVIPEPATMLLLGSGLIGFAVSGKKRFKKRKG